MLAGMELAREIARSGPYAQSLARSCSPGPTRPTARPWRTICASVSS